MGQTSDALASQQGIRIGYVLAIEGYPYLLTNFGASHFSAIATAWASTAWGAQAGWGSSFILPGLRPRGRIRQSIAPWAADLDVPTLTFEVLPDESDRFGIDVWRTKANYRTRLTDLFEPEPDGSGAVTVRSNVGFPGTGTVYIGNKAVEYSAKSGGTGFTVPAGGATKFAPFEAGSGNKYSRPHITPAQKNWETAGLSYVQDIPPTWIGRRVALYIHRIVGSVWDTRADAQLEFAGKIVALSETPEGHTVLGCEDLRADIRDAVLLKGQWVGYVKPGIHLLAGTDFYCFENVGSTGTTSDPLTVVSSGASGNDEVDAGYYELDEFVAILNKWAANDPNLLGTWRFAIEGTEEGRRFSITAKFSTSDDRTIAFYCTETHPLVFLGLAEAVRKSGDQTKPYFVYLDPKEDVDEVKIVSPRAPYRIKPFQEGRGFNKLGLTIDLESSNGSFIDYTSFLPAPFNTYPEAGEVWSFVRIGDRLYFGKYASETRLTDVQPSLNFAGYASNDGPDVVTGFTADDDGDIIPIYQVVVLVDSFTNIFTRLFASTDGRGVNHTTYDVFPEAMGCPGVPWDLLGDEFLDSCKSLDQALKGESVMVVLDRPRKLVDLLMPELQLRFAWLVFKNAHFVFTSPPTPNPLSTDWTLDETNKIMVGKDPRSLLSKPSVTKEHLRNIIKIEYNRTAGGKYRDVITVRDDTSIANHGETQTVTISAPNSYTDAAGTGAAVEDLAASLVARTMPMFARPMKVFQRTIAPTLFGMAPGDTITLSDEQLRDPFNGERGIGNRACICIAVTHDYGSEKQPPYGEVSILVTDEDRTFPLAPAAQVDHTVNTGGFTAGYDHANAKLKLVQHQHSGSSEAKDLTHLTAGDKVYIFEIDPEVPGSVVAWDRVIDDVDAAADEITLTAALSSPAFDSTKRYRITPYIYSEATEDQQLHAFLANGSDEYIEDLALPNLYGDSPLYEPFTRAEPTILHRTIPNFVYGEGRPVDAGLIYDLISNLNNAVSYRSAPNQPILFWADIGVSSGNLYRYLFYVPFFYGGHPYVRTNRYIKVAPTMAVTGPSAGQYVTCRVTSSKFPPIVNAANALEWVGPKKQVEFTKTYVDASSADPEEQAEQNLEIVGGDLPGITWLAVEWNSGTSATGGIFYGLSRLYLGPFG